MFELEFDTALLNKYDRSGPRYTSYPTAVQFSDQFGEAELHQAIERSNAAGGPLSLYFHIPFCNTVCFYCGCNKIATKDYSRSAPYLETMLRELAMYRKLLDRNREVRQLHLGGGTPTFMAMDEMSRLMSTVFEAFNCASDDDGEYSIEIDPREIDAEGVKQLRRMGFNRMSVGVQDFDPRVQQAVNRIQTEQETMAVIDAARECGFRSVSIDLIYGLPLQDRDSFLTTLDKIIAIRPDRLSVFNYAHLPERFKPQRRIDADELPSAATKMDIFQSTINHLQSAGYVHIGMDHFALPDDELALSQVEGKLHRNFQGFSTHADCDLVAIGVSSIGKLDNTYAQNVKDMDEYVARIEQGRFPLERGIELSRENELRRALINQLICNYFLDIRAFEADWGIDFAEHFSAQLKELGDMAQDGLLSVSADRIEVYPKGRLLARNVCMVFDEYLAHDSHKSSYSKAI